MAESKDAKARALISRIAATDDYYKVTAGPMFSFDLC